MLFLTAGFVNTTAGNFAILFPKREIVSETPLYLDQFHRLSGKYNVIHIVPDQAQGAMFHDILKSDYERFAEVFDGFTMFTQATGRYQSTYPSVLFYMTGEAPEPAHDRVLIQPFTWEYVGKTLDGQLVESADELIEGFRPGVMERLGVGPDDCLARNPRLVYGRMTGWGQEGPYAQAAGHEHQPDAKRARLFQHPQHGLFRRWVADWRIAARMSWERFARHDRKLLANIDGLTARSRVNQTARHHAFVANHHERAAGKDA